MAKTDLDMRSTWAAEHGLKLSRRREWRAILGQLPPNNPWSERYFEYITRGGRWDDHGEVWNRHGKAVCYTSHVYDEPDSAELAALASKHGIAFEVHPPDASWYYPSATWLVVLWAQGE